MAIFQHPNDLNLFQRYAQARTLLRNTSRASNDAWYKEALDHDLQLHVRVDGTGVLSYLHSRRTGRWEPGPPLDEETLRDTEKATEFARNAIAFARKLRAASLGLVLHVADEFSTSELKPVHETSADLEELRRAAELDSLSILQDSSIDPNLSSWRVLPYSDPTGEAIATSVVLSRHYGPFLDQVRLTGESENFPLIGHALSSGMVALMAIPRLVHPTEGRSFVVIAHYANFTTLAFFTPQGNLGLIRTLQHRGQRRSSNLAHALSTTAAALELIDPDVFLFNFSPFPDPDVFPDLRVAFPTSRVELIALEGTALTHPDLPIFAPEFLLATAVTEEPKSEEVDLFSQSITRLQAGRWLHQNFLPPPRAVSEIYPARSELRMLRAFRFLRGLIAIASLLILTWFGFKVFDTVRRPEWGYNATAARNVSLRLNRLNTERQRIEHWDNLLEDRSKGWMAMELISRLFPENSGFLIKGFSYTNRPVPAPGRPQVGFVREWKISGYAREEGNPRLILITSQSGISGVFDEMARITHNEAFRTDLGSRSLVSSIRTSENAAFRLPQTTELRTDDPSTYPTAFDLTITQRFESTDPMAVFAKSAP